MSDLISSFGSVYTFKRYAAPVMGSGQLQRPTEVLNNGQPWTMVASVQTLGTFDAVNLPEGLRNRDAMRIYTDTLMQVPDEDEGLLGDRFMYKGKLYEIAKSEDWINTDLPYYKFIAVKVPKA